MEEKGRVQRELQDEQDSSREKYMNQEKLVEDQLRILQMEVERLNFANQVLNSVCFYSFLTLLL